MESAFASALEKYNGLLLDTDALEVFYESYFGYSVHRHNGQVVWPDRRILDRVCSALRVAINSMGEGNV